MAASGGDLFVGEFNGTVAEYDASTGAAVNTSLTTGATNLQAVAVSGSSLYVQSGNSGILKYNLSGGTATQVGSGPLIATGDGGDFGLFATSTDLFVPNFNTGAVAEYDTNGNLITSTLLNAGAGVNSIFVVGSTLYVDNFFTGVVGEYTLGSTAGTITSSTPDLFTEADGANASPQEFTVLSATPEPSSYALAAIGGMFFVWLVRRRNSARS